tara:strand:+ start:9443 stop:9805 length:363 start_codon:yes stop_codon:yes gene_type:complete
MPTITLTFAATGDAGLNTSVQVGDVGYYVPTTAVAGFDTATQAAIVEIGVVTAVTTNSVTCDISTSTPSPTTNDFIFFSKDNQSNASGLIGYFAEIKFKNDSTTEAELFSVGSEVFESSK